MRPFLTTLAAGTAALLLSGCPDMPSGPAHSDAHWKVSRNTDADHKVSEIAWFQGTIDEAFSPRGCPQSHTRRGLFRF